MTHEEIDDLFYVCTMIEVVARKTHNKVKDVLSCLTDEQLNHQLKIAGVNHCLTFEQVSDGWIKDFDIKEGSFDNITTCQYDVPSETSIGRLYQTLIVNVLESKDKLIQTIRDVYNSFMSDEISNFNSSFYYSNPDYLKWCYIEGYVLD